MNSNVRYLLGQTTRAQNSLIQELGIMDKRIESKEDVDWEEDLFTLQEREADLEDRMKDLVEKCSTLDLHDDDIDIIDKKIEDVTATTQKARDMQLTIKKMVRNKTMRAAEEEKEIVETDLYNTIRNVENRLPPITVPIFSGDPTEWKNFYTVFDEAINSKNISKLEKFNYLIKSLRGPAKDVINRFQVAENTYDLAIAALKKRFDRRDVIVRHLTEQLKYEKAASPMIKHQRELLDRLNAEIQQLVELGEDLNSRMIKDLVLRKFSRDIQHSIFEVYAEYYQENEWDMLTMLDQIEVVIEKKECLKELMKPETTGINTEKKMIFDRTIGTFNQKTKPINNYL